MIGMLPSGPHELDYISIVGGVRMGESLPSLKRPKNYLVRKRGERHSPKKKGLRLTSISVNYFQRILEFTMLDGINFGDLFVEEVALLKREFLFEEVKEIIRKP